MTVITLPLLTSKADNIPDFDEIFNEGSEAKDALQPRAIKENSLYHERMSGIIVDMVDLGYI